MLILTAIQARYTGFSPKSSEEFNSASRSIKPGLIASGIVSAWTWAATLVSQLSACFCFRSIHTTRHIVAIQCCRLQIWHLWTVVVRRWCHRPSTSLRSGRFHMCFIWASSSDVNCSLRPSLSLMPLTHIHGLRLWLLDGVPLLILYSCSSGMFRMVHLHLAVLI